jgi:hypothetical protein
MGFHLEAHGREGVVPFLQQIRLFADARRNLFKPESAFRVLVFAVRLEERESSAGTEDP